MIRLLVAAAVLALAAAAVASAAEAPTREVDMPGKVFDPTQITVLTGTTVTWRNSDSTNHTVTADGGGFDSGYVGPGGSFSYTFARQGRYAYHCQIHKFMKGEVDVYSLVLTGPGHPVTAGSPVTLSGLASAGTTSVALVQVGSKAPVRTVKPRPDGSFTIHFRAPAPGAFRVISGTGTSPLVTVQVMPVVSTRRSGRTLVVTTTPDRPGARVALQTYVRDLFTWRTVARTRLSASSRARLTLPADSERVRVVVRGGKGWADGTSGQIVLHR